MGEEPVRTGRWADRIPPPISWEQLEQAQEDKTRREVIVEDALFKDVLGYLIECAFPPRNDVLNTLLNSMELNDRARLACVLGLIQKGTMQDLHRIHNIRNKWAHMELPDFSDKEWKRDVLALSTVGSDSDKVTGKNYMNFFWQAVADCRKALFQAITSPSPLSHSPK